MADNRRGKAAFFDDDAFKVEPDVAVATKSSENNTTIAHNKDTQTQQTYTTQEMRSKRVQFVIKPSVNEKLDELAKNGAIKSKNDLVNFLLENYIAQLEG